MSGWLGRIGFTLALVGPTVLPRLIGWAGVVFVFVYYPTLLWLFWEEP